MKRKRKEQRFQNNQKISSKIAIICVLSHSVVSDFVTPQTINYFKCRWPRCYKITGLYTSKMSRSRNKGRPKTCSRSKEIKETWQLNETLDPELVSPPWVLFLILHLSSSPSTPLLFPFPSFPPIFLPHCYPHPPSLPPCLIYCYKWHDWVNHWNLKGVCGLWYFCTSVNFLILIYSCIMGE